MELDRFVAASVDSMMNTMQQLLRRGEAINPQIFLFAIKGEGWSICPLVGVERYFVSKEEKRKLRHVVKHAWERISTDEADIQLKAVITLTDAWIEVPSPEEAERMFRTGRRDAPFTAKPGMAETLLVQISLAECDWTYRWPYLREGKELVFAPAPIKEKNPNIGPVALAMRLWPL